ncbi:uncharacterized protein ACN2A1_009852 isoform 1-T1 [Glossina fuscipes fuscipes]
MKNILNNLQYHKMPSFYIILIYMRFFIIGSVGVLHPASSSIAVIASVSVPITELLPERSLFIDWCFQMSYDLPHSLSSFYNVPIWPSKQNSKHQKRESSFRNQTLWSPWEKYNMLTFTKRHPNDFTANELYQGIEDIMKSYGYHENCLLLSICELAQHPFADDDVNVLTNILTFVLSPSLHGRLDHPMQLNVELYEAAELNGLLGRNCREIYFQCNYNLFNSFTKVIFMDL